MDSSRAEFHRQHRLQASAEALRLFERKAELRGAWLNWVAAQLYALGPAEYVSMVRRELQQLQSPGTQ
ncbi:hypothetical protein [Pseudomonas sp. MWU13-2105]|uniref:hypothetical protein n=1 Tax=Pseudomonas sp. MWU13-2105 TaxID=2935074 RepID=UPI00200EEFC6|nr:hypothetical protein [Pseudomonas sp. MWU13-2105]